MAKAKWVRLKSPRELHRLGYRMPHVSDDGQFMHIHHRDRPGVTVGIDTDPSPRLVIVCDTIHENTLKILPDAFEEVEHDEPIHP